MRSYRRSFGIGVIIGVTGGAAILLLAFFLTSVFPHAVAMAPAPSGTPTFRSSPVPTDAPPFRTPTYTPIATSSLSANLAPGFNLEATATPDAVAAAIVSGDLVFSGPLPGPQQAAVYRASLKYAQNTVAASKRASKEINGVGYGDPTNICGPLAIAILRDAGVLPEDIVPHDYWLLDPMKVPDQRLIEAAFPADRFVHQKEATPLNKMDWSASPLHPGDFLFIWHGSWGNFDHMLVVSRIDSQGRAFAVTNYGTPAGYIIAETMLYDPSDRKAGIFHTWTQARDQVLGSTGFGGFEVWRLRVE